jgi:hypothetical protein
MPLPTREELEAQKIINQIKMQSGPPPGHPVQTTFSACPQCGIIHPPLRSGEKCPLAKVKNKDGKVIDFEKFLADLKIMLISQFETRQIVNHEDVFKKIKMEVMKILEGYKA